MVMCLMTGIMFTFSVPYSKRAIVTYVTWIDDNWSGFGLNQLCKFRLLALRLQNVNIIAKKNADLFLHQ